MFRKEICLVNPSKYVRIVAIVVIAAMLLSSLVAGIGMLFSY
ncbi:stressosome-associated protein Prli42 [Paenibacillus algorifonticola]|nr:stressosome-associated protein Prli42 [Paenibacillus sp. Leaf72]